MSSRIEKLRAFLLSDRGYWLIFFSLLLLKNGYYLYKYYPVVDDWFIFLGNATYADRWNDVLIPNGLLKLRPLAGLMDVYITGGVLSEHLSLVFLSLTLLHGASAYLFVKTLEAAGVAAGPVFLAVYVFLPFNAEALYWISASSRIVPTLFFIALSGSLVQKHALTRKKSALLGFAAVSLLSVGFYEATLPLVVAYPFAVLLLGANAGERPRASYFAPLLISIGSVAFIAAYYALNSDSSDISARGGLVTGNYPEHFGNVVRQLWALYTQINAWLSAHALKQGVSVILADRAVLFAAVTAAACAALGFAARRQALKKKNSLLKSLSVGVVLFAAGIAVNFPLAVTRPSLRVGYIGFLGLGIALQAVCDFVTAKAPRLKAIASAALICVCVAANVGELSEYKTTSETDIEIARRLLASGSGERLAAKNGLGILLGAVKTYFPEQMLYYEHKKTAIEAYACLTGALRHLLGHPNIYNVMVADDSGKCLLWDIERLEEVYYFWGLDDELNVMELKAEASGDGRIVTLYTADGGVYGTLKFVDGNTYEFELH